MIDEGELRGTPDAACIDAAGRAVSRAPRSVQTKSGATHCFVGFARERRDHRVAG
ncbi:MAG: hypothetical protein AB7I32_11510 [Gammaproteobacteria bacterium]